MRNKLRLLCVFAHPDDETLGTGGTLAHYAAQGIETYVITATKGQRGWVGDAEDYPGFDELGDIRAKELCDAADVLNVKEVTLLDYVDGDLQQADSKRIVSQLVEHIRRIRPQVVVTFDPFGAYGHPDHIAICQYTTAAVFAAADSGYSIMNLGTPFSVSKLYYLVSTQAEFDVYEQAFGELVMNVDGQERRAAPWAEWSITTSIDIAEYREQIWEAVACHRTQVPQYESLINLPAIERDKLWTTQDYYCVFSHTDVSSTQETDLFAGLRHTMMPETSMLRSS